MVTTFEDTLAYSNLEKLTDAADCVAKNGQACYFVVETHVRGEKLSTSIHAGTEQSAFEPVQKVMRDSLRDLNERGDEDDTVKCSLVLGALRIELARATMCGSEEFGDRRVILSDTTCESFVLNGTLLLIPGRRAEHRITT